MTCYVKLFKCIIINFKMTFEIIVIFKTPREGSDSQQPKDAPNEDASKFYRLLKDAKNLCTKKYNELAAIVVLYHLKSLFGWSNKSFNMLLGSTKRYASFRNDVDETIANKTLASENLSQENKYTESSELDVLQAVALTTKRESNHGSSLHTILTTTIQKVTKQVRKVSYRPPGTQHNLLNEVSLSLPEKSFGLIFGRSGSGKTTLLQLLSGLSKPISGSIYVQSYSNDGNPNQPPQLLSPERVGIVFQFPERFFLADTVLEEVTFGWPRQKADLLLRQQLALKLQYAINSVGLNTISLDEDPHTLSGGFKRRLALAIQLVQTPDLLLLDEPLAGLDWKARADVVKLLKHLKKDLTILVVSHDLKELSSLVDFSWRMEMGGILKEEPLPV
uniref:ABC transporter domain-containing protein n=1 Tax=Ananas comosus var. bracteatus TaxID=296719 RepID=A0A6V7Q0G0_ANACO|nr:unnamed protein product [Ananas comosus var. bracteatus]